jgi:hypothetical protein
VGDGAVGGLVRTDIWVGGRKGETSYRVLPGFQPTPTTKSLAVLKLREKLSPEGVKLTVPPVL